MKVGNKIRLQHYMMGHAVEQTDHTVEKFRHCLGVFLTEQHRQAGDFTPLCELYEPGPESRQVYISNYGEYWTNKVQAWMDLPSDMSQLKKSSINIEKPKPEQIPTWAKYIAQNENGQWTAFDKKPFISGVAPAWHGFEGTRSKALSENGIFTHGWENTLECV